MSKNFVLKEKGSQENSPCATHSQDIDPASSSNLMVYEKLVEKNAELDQKLKKFTGIIDKESDLKTVMDQLHRYNDVKDATQIVLGRLANLEGTTVGELHERYGLTSNDC